MKSSKLSLLFIGVVFAASFFHYRTWTKGSVLNGGDDFGYYSYLPAIFVHNDLNHLRHSIYARDMHVGIVRDSTQPVTDVGETYIHKGVPVIKYTPGIAILESPSFFLAHLYCHFFDKDKDDGFSPPYLLSVNLWNALIVFIGLLFLRKFLLFHFPDSVVATVLVVIGLATNLYHFAIYNTGMSHGYLFMLYSALLLYSHRFYQNYGRINPCIIGLSAGMITLIRPNEVTALFIPLLYGVSSVTLFKERIKHLVSKTSILWAVGVFVLCVLPANAYWYYATGKIFFYSYGSESFDFTHPHVIRGLFGYMNGWLPYTPVMIFACVGGLFLFTKGKKLLLPILFILPIHIVVIYSWWCWNYINGLGSRPMIEMYPLLSFPLCLWTAFVFRKKWSSVLWAAIILLLGLQQLLFTYKIDNNYLWSELSNSGFYYQTLFKTHLDIEDLIVFDTGEKQPKHPQYLRNLAFHDFEDSTSTFFHNKQKGLTGRYFLLDSSVRYYTGIEGTIQSLGLSPGQWLRVSIDACNQYPPGGLYQFAGVAVQIDRNDAMISLKQLRIQNKFTNNGSLGVWRFDPDCCGNAWFFTQIPNDANPDDFLKVYLYNGSYTTEEVDNFKVDLYNE
ncbi:MAG: hypothetical protein V4615_01715 [Bacteroidota bacterium]